MWPWIVNRGFLQVHFLWSTSIPTFTKQHSKQINILSNARKGQWLVVWHKSNQYEEDMGEPAKFLIKLYQISNTRWKQMHRVSYHPSLSTSSSFMWMYCSDNIVILHYSWASSELHALFFWCNQKPFTMHCQGSSQKIRMIWVIGGSTCLLSHANVDPVFTMNHVDVNQTW